MDSDGALTPERIAELRAWAESPDAGWSDPAWVMGLAETVRPLLDAEAIVRALADAPAPLRDYEWAAGEDEACEECTACGTSVSHGEWERDRPILRAPDRHEPDCPWRLAREWVAQHPEEKT